MANEPHEPILHDESRGTYEHTDASPRLIVYFVVVLLAIIGFSQLLLAGLGRWFFVSTPQVEVSPLAPDRTLPPNPRLQVSPGRDMRSYKEDELRKLRGEASGVQAISIEEAKQRVLSSGAFASQPPSQPVSGALIPLDSGGLARVGSPVPSIQDDKEKLHNVPGSTDKR
ncbi:MAG: hypothetical protein SFV54_27745 [Bryobacteraceae bacterium]|nr:hypothetical protein [Bryobacteraceae bacterium]